MIRSNKWLSFRLKRILHVYFKDKKLANTILVKFGRASRTRLGSIKLVKVVNGEIKVYRPWQKYLGVRPTSLITINGKMTNSQIPVYIVDIVLAHELIHYFHGFNSTNQRLWRYPHQGGVVDKELRKRGMGDQLVKQKAWIKQNWSQR